MANSQDQFEARLRKTHKRLRRYEESLKELEAYFHERPQGAADALLLSVPVQLEVQRKYALSRFGVDLEDREQRKRLRWTNLLTRGSTPYSLSSTTSLTMRGRS
jgi:hypothetical protein